MANDLTGRPWVIDTFSTANVVKAGRTHLTGFTFRDYTGGAASVATIKDGLRGVTICELKGVAGNLPQYETYFYPQNINNIIINADSGVVEVVVK